MLSNKSLKDHSKEYPISLRHFGVVLRNTNIRRGMVQIKEYTLEYMLPSSTKGRVNKKCDLFHTRGGGGGRRSNSLGDFVAAQNLFVCLQEAQKQTLCSLLSSDMLDIASNFVVKSSCSNSDTSIADTRQW